MKFGLIAKDIHNSVLPRTFEVFSKDVGISSSFQIFNVPEERLAETVAFCRTGLDGFIVTMPYKRAILGYVDQMDVSAEQCGSSNCCLVEHGKLTAYNTDGWGFIKNMQLKGFNVSGKHVVMVGAGGVAMSLAYHLLVNNVACVDVFNVYEDELLRLCRKFGEEFKPHLMDADALRQTCRSADLFLNASVLGQVGYPEYEDTSFLNYLPKHAVVYDVNYSNPEARLPAAARKLELKTYVGCAMSACQGIRAMEIWTGKTPSDVCAAELVQELEAAHGER